MKEATVVQTVLLSDIQFCKKSRVIFNDIKRETSVVNGSH